MEIEEIPALVVGAGPAGLMAAEALTAAGHPVRIADAMPSPARKLLMAGKSGLNLTKDEPEGAFRTAYATLGTPVPAALAEALAAFGPRETMAWAEGLGQPLVTGSTGRVFPVAWKASPLLRAWLARLGAAGATLYPRWRWEGFEGDASRFATPEGPRLVRPQVTVLAMGGASWARLGSDGAWAAHLPSTPFQPANAGLLVAWSPHMAPHLGRPVKGVRWQAGPLASRGEAVVSARGLEGGGLYPLTPAIRAGHPLTLDLVPDLALETLRARLATRGSESLANRLRKRLGLDGVRAALLNEWGRTEPGGTRPADLAPLLKALPVRHDGLRPLDEAISTAGGLSFAAMDGFMLTDRPGTYAAGEMLDWEAPTGGYLLTACLATGRAAGLAASNRLALEA